jgi:hypothetical protein
VFVVVDVPLPKLKVLRIEGGLELDAGIDHYLEVEVIFINGGQLIVGWEDKPILRNVSIVLTGEKSSPAFTLPDGLTKMGGKSIGVYGGLDLHGEPRSVVWTRLARSAMAGSKDLQLVEAVDWRVGEEVMVTTTSYVVEQTEVRRVAAVSLDKRTVSLEAALGYDHYAFNETLPGGGGYQIAAAVGLLSRSK